MQTTPNTLMFDLTDYESMRPYLALRLANKRSQKSLIDACPGDPYLDLFTLPYLLLNTDEGQADDMHAMPVHRDLLESWGVSRRQLFSDAIHNMPLLLPPSLKTLEDTLEACQDKEESLASLEPEDSFSCGLYVLTNKRAIFGAAVMLYPGLMEEIHRCLGPYYVLPCSVHEVIIAPDNEALSPTGLAEIVHNVNREVLDDRDYLSDSVYYYGEKGLCMLYSEIA